MTKPSVRLNVERLEDRAVPATFQWRGNPNANNFSSWTNGNLWTRTQGDVGTWPGENGRTEDVAIVGLEMVNNRPRIAQIQLNPNNNITLANLAVTGGAKLAIYSQVTISTGSFFLDGIPEDEEPGVVSILGTGQLNVRGGTARVRAGSIVSDSTASLNIENEAIFIAAFDLAGRCGKGVRTLFRYFS